MELVKKIKSGLYAIIDDNDKIKSKWFNFINAKNLFDNKSEYYLASSDELGGVGIYHIDIQEPIVLHQEKILKKYFR